MSKNNPIDPRWKERNPDVYDWFPTHTKQYNRLGRVVSTDNEVWLYQQLPQSAILEAKNINDMVKNGDILQDYLTELADKTPIKVGRQSLKSAYRHFHLLVINSMHPFVPPYNHKYKIF